MRLASLSLILIVLAWPARASAQMEPLCSVRLMWTPPTENIDGSPAVLVAYKFYYGTSSGNYLNSQRVNDPGISSYTVEALTCGQTFYFVATAINTTGAESDFSNEAIKTTGGDEPPPPGPLTAIGGDVYTIRQENNRFVFLDVATVPADTPCLPGIVVNQYHGIDRNLVQWKGNVKPRVVVTLCR